MDTIIFADAHQKPSVLVPVVRATPDALIGYGRLVSDFDAEDIIRVTWPKSTVPGTGNRQLPMEEDVRISWKDDILYTNGHPSGKLLTEGSRDYLLVHYSNYHPDGGQVFFPLPGGRPYVMLLAAAAVGDDIRPEHFRAFHFDGSVGFHIAPGVWHWAPYIQPPSRSGDEAEMTFRNKQGSVFACVAVDTLDEFGVFLKVPLSLDA